jgi:hypothetical protein
MLLVFGGQVRVAFTQTLSAGQLSRAWKRLVDERLVRDGAVSLSKADLVAAASAVQDYLWANRAAINTAIPQPARGALNTEQKMALLAIVALVNMEG